MSKLARDFASLGLSFSKNTLFDYVALLEDPGLVAAFKAGADRDVEHKLETAVFLDFSDTTSTHPRS